MSTQIYNAPKTPLEPDTARLLDSVSYVCFSTSDCFYPIAPLLANDSKLQIEFRTFLSINQGAANNVSSLPLPNGTRLRRISNWF